MASVQKKDNTLDYENIKNNILDFTKFIENSNDGKIIKLLDKLGRLSNENIIPDLIKLAESKNPKVRSSVMKNLAKFGKIELLELFMNIAVNDESTDVRREAASAVGRLRDERNIPSLTILLQDSDPKVVQQAIRGLLVFKKNDQVLEALKKIENHKNEQIQDLLSSFFSNKTKQPNKTKESLSTTNKNFRNLVINGDTIKITKMLPPEIIDLTFTSPPYYNARDYSIYESYEDYLEFLKNVFSNVHRITKEGRFLAVNSSPIIVPRVSRAHASRRYPIPFDLHNILIKIGWEFIDDIVWLKPEASVKNRNAGFLQNRKPLAYKPNSITEMIMVYRKKTDKLIDWNIKQYAEDIVANSLVKDGYETTNVWKIDPTFDKTHSAVFPNKLCERIINYYSYVGDLVFDPFAGSGTLGVSARELSRNFLLTEISPVYFDRIQSLLLDTGIFNQDEDVRFINYEQLFELVNEK
jgi:DNA modification methylase